MHYLRTSLVGLAALLACPAMAFDAFSMAGQQAVGYSFDTMQRNRANIAMNAAVAPRNGARSPRPATTAGAAPNMLVGTAGGVGTTRGSLAYTGSRALSEQAQRDFLKRLSSRNPQAAGVAADQLSRHDFNKAYASLVRGTGLSTTDVVDIMAAFMMLGWMISNDAQADPDPSALLAVRAQLGPGLSAEPRFANPQQRAALGEELKILFVTLHAGWQSAKKEGNLGTYADGVSALFRRQGADMRALRLTDAGFAPT